MACYVFEGGNVDELSMMNLKLQANSLFTQMKSTEKMKSFLILSIEYMREFYKTHNAILEVSFFSFFFFFMKITNNNLSSENSKIDLNYYLEVKKGRQGNFTIAQKRSLNREKRRRSSPC